MEVQERYGPNSDIEVFEGLCIYRTELAFFTRQFAVLLDSGIELPGSLRVLLKGAESEDLQAVLARIIGCIESGWELSRTLEQFPSIFNQVYLSMVAVGQETGSLPRCLHAVADWLDSEDRLIRDIKGHLYYPVTVLVVGFVLAVVFLTVVFPGFAESIATGDGVPLPTRILMTTSSLMLNPLAWLGTLVGASLFVRSARLFLSINSNQVRIYKAILLIPVLGPTVRAAVCGRFCAALGILQDSGVDVLKSFRLACLASGSPLAQEQIRAGVETIVSGGRMSDYLSAHPKAFPRVMLDLLSTAEETARVPEICFRLQDILEFEARTKLKALTGLLEPMLMVIVSAVVATLIVCTALPMYGQFLNSL